MNKIQLIEEAIDLGRQEKSQLTDEVIAIGGFTSNKIRHTLNNLGSISTRVFEVGSHRGATLCSTIYKNHNINSVICVDNFSEFNDDGNPKQDLEHNLYLFSPCVYLLIEHDCFDIGGLAIEPDLYIYDGNHSDWAQKKALTHFYSMLPDEFIFCVDDSSWPSVKKGTQEGLKEMNYKILFEQHLFDGKEGGEWHNGFSVYLLKK